MALATASVEGPEPVMVGGVAFDRSYPQPGGELELVGAGVLRWKVFFRAYAAAFYLPAGVEPTDWSEDVAKCLTIHYFWDVPKEKFGPAGVAVLKRMYSPEQLSGLREPLERLGRAYVDVREGDRYTLAYDPGRGTSLWHNGHPLVIIPGAEFARLYFSIWLGSEPVGKRLRDHLLGRN